MPQALLYCAFCAGLLTFTLPASSHAAVECEQKRIEREVLQQQFAIALTIEDQCITEDRHEFTSGPSDSLTLLRAARVTADLYGRAQLLAILGELDQAYTAYLTANDFAETAGLTSPISMLPSPPGGTDGYILERRGDLKDALLRYAETHVYGRAALVALALKDDERAKELLADAAHDCRPDCQLALGLLAEKSGKRLEAWNHFHEARTRIFKALEENPIEPLYYLEWPRIEQGLKRTE